MNDGNILRIDKPYFKIPLRIVTLITLFLSTCSLVQSVLMFQRYSEQQDLSMFVVVLFLMISPLTFLASLFFAWGIHKIAGGTGADRPVILGYAMLMLTAVDDLIYVSVQRDGDMLSFYLLGGIRLICFGICFLYYQDYVTSPLAFCACVLLAGCVLLDTIDLIRYIGSVSSMELPDLYYLVKSAVNVLIAVEGFLFLFGIHKGIRTKVK